MDVPVDASNEFSPQIEPPIVFLVVALEVIDDFRNVKVEDAPPVVLPKVDIPFGDPKVEDALPVVVPPNIVVSIDHREHFTTKEKFATHYDLLEWVREEVWKLGFSTVIGKSDKGGNGINAFFIVICKRGGSYTEYKKLSRRKISDSVKCECLFRVRSYLLVAGDWSLKVGDGRYNHEMTVVLKGHKRLNPNESTYTFMS